MRTILLFILTACLMPNIQAQSVNPEDTQPDSTNYSNIYVKKISEDSLQSTYIIWVKKEVKTHYHDHHTELIYVLGGSGIMTFNDSTFKVNKGDFFMIPMQTHHSVITTSDVPLKVMSIQCPKFDGDRIWVDEQ